MRRLLYCLGAAALLAGLMGIDCGSGMIYRQAYFAAEPRGNCGLEPCGYMLTMVNREAMYCPSDAAMSPTCKVTSADWQEAAMKQVDRQMLLPSMYPGMVLVRGDLELRAAQGVKPWGHLNVSEVWQAAGAAQPQGTLYWIVRAPFECLDLGKPPICDAYTEVVLNGADAGTSRIIRGLDLSQVGASAQAMAMADYALDDVGLIVSGSHSGSIYNGAFKAAQFYLRIDPAGSPKCLGGVGCPSGYFCDTGFACGGFSGRVGVCRSIPSACPESMSEPMCGCNEQTYVTDCHRLKAQMQMAYPGACLPPIVVY